MIQHQQDVRSKWRSPAFFSDEQSADRIRRIIANIFWELFLFAISCLQFLFLQIFLRNFSLCNCIFSFFLFLHRQSWSLFISFVDPEKANSAVPIYNKGRLVAVYESQGGAGWMLQRNRGCWSSLLTLKRPYRTIDDVGNNDVNKIALLKVAAAAAKQKMNTNAGAVFVALTKATTMTTMTTTTTDRCSILASCRIRFYHPMLIFLY